MPNVVISVENVGKKYSIVHKKPERYTALRDVLAAKAAAPVRWLRRNGAGWNGLSNNCSTEIPRSRSRAEDFWALKDVSFEVRQGEVVGIIGRNGAGKSTLLKILSRITDMTEGRVRIRGRVASLLEVGTGFHPELTGRENIFVNGAILGMTRQEIVRRFDEIVAFAEIEKFLDTPVKRYSSGMQVRLAFAVAAHLDPEILIVDEVLAVGDAEFQKKCLGKIHDASAKQGRTVLFVSHNMAAVQALCSAGFLLEGGRIGMSGPVEPLIRRYLQRSQTSTSANKKIAEGVFVSELSASPNILESGSKATIQLHISTQDSVRYEELCIFIYSTSGMRLSIIDLRPYLKVHSVQGLVTTTAILTIAALPFVEGDYDLGIWIRSNLVTGDFLKLGQFTVTPKLRQAHVAPYVADCRGLIELEYSAEVRNS